MGISGLLPALKSIQKPMHIKNWAGKTVAIDAYGWLHRGTVSCAIELALGKPTTKYVEFAMGRVRMLMHFGVIPYLVFDGDHLPSKAGEESERAARREAGKKAGLELLRQGKSSQAYLELQKAIDVTPQMARHLIDALIEAQVKYVVAPYEADAQMYYLERNGIVDAILSEDSDLLVFGCRNLITKLSQYGECVGICRDDFSACKEMSLTGWTDVEFRSMAILSGCDYLENIPRLGLKTAHRLVRKHKNIEKIIRLIRFDGQYSVPADYVEQFQRAELTFLHQRVYCPIVNRMVMCTEPVTPLTDEHLIFIGPEIEEELAQKVARGELDPMTKEPLITGNKNRTIKSNLDPRLKQALPPPLLATPLKPTATLFSFFKPVTPAQQNSNMAAQSVPSKKRPETQIKRRSSISCEREEPQAKKIKIPGPTIPTSPEPDAGEGVSKYFQIPKPRKNKLKAPTPPNPQAPLPKFTGKENLRPEENIAGSSSEASTTMFPFKSKLQDYTDDNRNVETSKEDTVEDPAMVVAKGWRDRYSLKPSATVRHLASLMKAASSPSSTTNAPLQRIGTNILRGSNHPVMRTPAAMRVTQKSMAKQPTVSLKRYAVDSSVTREVVEEESDSSERFHAEEVKETGSDFTFAKFLYTQSPKQR